MNDIVKCRVDGCNFEKKKRSSLCNFHHWRWYTYKDLTLKEDLTRPIPSCDIHQIKKTKNGQSVFTCKICKSEYNKALKEKNKEYIKNQNKNYYQENKKRQQAWTKQDRKDHPERYVQYSRNRYSSKKVEITTERLAKAFNMTVEQYNQMFIDCNNLCEICNKPEKMIVLGIPKRLCVDHNHTTGMVRGILCGTCNLQIGMIQEDIERIKQGNSYFNTDQIRQSAITYLKKHGSQ